MQITRACQPSLSPFYICKKFYIFTFYILQNAREGTTELSLYTDLWSPPTLEANGWLSALTSAYKPPCHSALTVMHLLLRLLRPGPPAVLLCTVQPSESTLT